MTPVVLGAPISGQLSLYFRIKRDISAALSADADIRDHADRVTDLAHAAGTELTGILADLKSFEREIRQGSMF